MLSIEIFGKSHDEYIGAVLYGLPKGEKIDMDNLLAFVQRRKPGTRHESDIPVFLSGITDDKTDGRPLKLTIRNQDVRPQDYDNISATPRPGHADYPAFVKWDGKEDMHGGGKFSGRMTAPLCAAGGIVKQILHNHGIEVSAEVVQLGNSTDPAVFDKLLNDTCNEYDSLGGIVRCTVSGMPVGVGDNLFDGLDGAISYYIFGIPGCKGIEFGAGFGAAALKGSQNNDEYRIDDNGKVVLTSNNAGGILGGMSNGEDIVFNAVFKPTPSIGKVQKSVNLENMSNVEMKIEGRHDTAYVLRVPPIVEACCALAILSQMSDMNDSIDSLRCCVDDLDSQISRLLSKRFLITDTIVKYKETVRDERREERVIDNIRNNAQIPCPDSIEQIYRSIMAESRKRQEKIKNA